jgi:hypothetical protein
MAHGFGYTQNFEKFLHEKMAEMRKMKKQHYTSKANLKSLDDGIVRSSK